MPGKRYVVEGCRVYYSQAAQRAQPLPERTAGNLSNSEYRITNVELLLTIVLLLAICLLVRASSLQNFVAEEEWPEDWEDEVEETSELANVRREEAERFGKLFSISNEFDVSIFAGEVEDDDDDIDSKVEGHGRRLLQAANILDNQNALLHFKQGISLDPNSTLQGWNTSANEDHCAWTGVTCSNITNRVIGLNLTGVPGAKLIGTINPNIALPS